MSAAPELTIGIEEEYLLVDRATGALIAERDPGFLETCQAELGEDRVHPELMQCQVEIGTGVCGSIVEARRELAQLRGTVASVAARHGMAPVAASTHPFSDWAEQRISDVERYRELTAEHQHIARRALIGGMHVHIGIADEETRVRVMRRMIPYLPMILALSASSPFWRGRDTGLKAFRPTIFCEFPRSGIPDGIDSWADWQAYTAILAETGLCTDPTRIWWDVRPSAKHPTLEMRIAEVCTDVEDALTIAALCQSLAARLAATPEPLDTGWRRWQRMLTDDNKWRAQRWGAEVTLADLDRRALVPLAQLVRELTGELRGHAEQLGCTAELMRANDIAASGTSADRQLAIFRDRRAAGASDVEALRAVVGWLVETTVKVAA